MEIGQLRALVAVIDERGFTGAADRLGVRQSTVSRAVASLERDLGVPLLVRGTRGAHSLTGAGVRIVEQARQVLERLDLIESFARMERREATGILRIGTTPSVGPLLVPVIAAFRREYPGIRVALLQGRDSELVQWLDTGFIDIATVAKNADTSNTPSNLPHADQLRLADDQWVAVLPQDHPLTEVPLIALSELEDDTLLMSDGGCEPLVREIYERKGLTCRVDLKIADMATLLTLVREGMGITIVPELCTTGFHGIRVVRIDTGLKRRVVLATSRIPMSRVTERFVAFMAERREPDVKIAERSCKVPARSATSSSKQRVALERVCVLERS